MARRSSGHHASAGLEPAQEPLVSTYQTRVADYAGMDRLAGDAALTNYAELHGRVQRKLFADVAAGGSAAALKGAYLQRYGIPARMFNAVRVSLDGKVASVRESQLLQLDSLRRRVSRAEKQVWRSNRGVNGGRFIRSSGGWLIFDTGWLDWKPTLRPAGCGCALAPRSCGGSSMT